MEVKNIKNQIKNILQGKTGLLASDLFAVTYGYPRPQPVSYPSARVYITSGNNQEIQSYTQNYSIMNFVVDCTFIYSDNENTYDTVLDIFSDLLIELNKQENYTLSGEAEFVLADQFEFYYPQDMDSQKYIGFIIQIKVGKLTNNL